MYPFLFSDKLVRFFNEQSSIVWCNNEDIVESISAPLNAMLDQRGEVSEGTNSDTLFRRVFGTTVALSLVRNDHLRVGLGSEGARLQQGLFVPDTAIINVKTGIDVINCINEDAEALPELVIENVLGFSTHE